MRISTLLMLAAAPLALAACGSGAEQHAMDDTAMGDMDMGDHDMSSMDPVDGATRASTTGTVTAIDREAGTITIDHEPVPELDWPRMIMAFEIRKDVGHGLTVGNVVLFEFSTGSEGNVITSISKN